MERGALMKWIVPVALVSLCLMWVPSAAAEDLSTSLANAEQEVTSTEAEVSAKQQQLEKADAKLGAAAADAAPFVRALNRNRAELQRLRADLSQQEEEPVTASPN